jgi:hypothetical protein
MRIEHSACAQGHAHRCLVTEHARGWQIQQEKDSVVIRNVVRDDWHRVERDLWLFDLETKSLQQDPFRIDPLPGVDASASD